MVDSSNFIKKGDDFRQEAAARLKGSFFGNFMSSKADRQEQAKELYQQAANCYKAGRDPEQAVECMMLCLELEQDPS